MGRSLYERMSEGTYLHLVFTCSERGKIILISLTHKVKQINVTPLTLLKGLLAE